MLFIVNSRSVWGSKWREGHEEQKSVLCSGVAIVCLVLVFFFFFFFFWRAKTIKMQLCCDKVNYVQFISDKN